MALKVFIRYFAKAYISDSALRMNDRGIPASDVTDSGKSDRKKTTDSGTKAYKS